MSPQNLTVNCKPGINFKVKVQNFLLYENGVNVIYKVVDVAH